MRILDLFRLFKRFRLNSREKRKFTRKKFRNFEWLYAEIRDKLVEIYPSKIVVRIKIKIGDEKWGSWDCRKKRKILTWRGGVVGRRQGPVNHGWFALWYLQLSQNWRLPSVKISDFVTAMYRGIDTLIGYVLFRPRGPANQTSRSLSSIQTIYTILEPPCSTCPFPYPFLDHIQIWTKTRRNETLSHRVEIVDRFQGGGEGLHLIRFCRDKERKFRSRRSRERAIKISSFLNLLALCWFWFSSR